ncbi:hypothetical protein [Chryseobacterium bernardetii]|uniref:hypothetical protein n=1 Tax=Chryseobacterium bernardetii TaxID=1241978 RepID=UPI003AF55ACE
MGTKKSYFRSLFEDVLNIIKNNKDEKYQILVKEIEEAIFFYSWTLDFRNKSIEDLLLLINTVNTLIYLFDEIYSQRTEEEIIQIYKKSLIKLIETLSNSIKYYETLE